MVRLVLFVVFLMSRFLDFGNAGDTNVSTGLLDPRGFQPLYADAATGEPIRFNPCEPIHYVVNPANAPVGGLQDAHDAFETTSRATGMKFVYDGTTTEEFMGTRDAVQSDRYGERWAPILVMWSSEPLRHQDPSGVGMDVVGLGGPRSMFNEDGQAVYVTGVAVFDATNALSSGRGGAWRQVMLHELGHVVGLAHVQDPGSVMYTGPTIQPGEFGKGDRAGLWELGLGSGCVKSPPLP